MFFRTPILGPHFSHFMLIRCEKDNFRPPSKFRGPATDKCQRGPPNASRLPLKWLFMHCGAHDFIFEDFGNKSAENWERTSRNQFITNAYLETQTFEMTSTQQTADYKIGGRRCSRRMAHRDPLRVRSRPRRVCASKNCPLLSMSPWYIFLLFLYLCRYLAEDFLDS